MNVELSSIRKYPLVNCVDVLKIKNENILKTDINKR